MNILRSSWLRPLLALVVLLAAVAWIAGMFNQKTSPGLASPAASQEEDFVPAVMLEVPVLEAVPGSLQAKQATLVSSRVMAGITSISVRAGDSVRVGDVLILLEQDDAKARLAQAESQVAAVDARTREARLALKRALTLHEKSLIAIADVDKARANQEASEAELISARQQQAEAIAALQYTEIRSPIDGTVVDRFAEPGDTATPGNQLLSLYNPLTLRVEAAVREQLAVRLVIGQSMNISVPSLGKKVSGRIDELVPAADPGSRSFLIKASLNFDEQLRPGMYAELEVPGAVVQQVLVPASSVARVGQLNVIWVKQEGEFVRRFVKIGQLTADGRIEILSGLDSGEYVLIVPPTLK